jgi:uncharacterized membrane protein
MISNFKLIAFVMFFLIFEQVLSINTILNRAHNRQKAKETKTKIVNGHNSDGALKMLAFKAVENKNGLTNKDIKTLASLIVDWAKNYNNAKKQTTVYWYSRQG